MNKRGAWVLLLAVALLAWQIAARHAPPAEPSSSRADNAIAALSTEHNDSGFAHAEQPRRFEFPRDHAAHPEFRSEWWYFTGHLRDANERPFGFQLTLFRFELAADKQTSPSVWRTPTVLLGHFALSDIATEKFHAFERMSRALPATAGTSQNPAAVWLDDWRVELDAHGHWQLHATQQGVSLTLTLDAASAVVLQGEAGLSRKSAAAGNASYYYSLPKLNAEGELILADGSHQVRGEAWLDREWSTSALSREQAGWDWFALQLADGGSLMFYRLRQRNGGTDNYSTGTYVDAQGRQHPLTANDVQIKTLAQWRSPHSARSYPQGWRLEVPSAQLRLELTPRLADQEWRGRFQYWEGAVTVTRDGRPAGLGYVELTGY
jgi:predicted secreted hydrolase